MSDSWNPSVTKVPATSGTGSAWPASTAPVSTQPGTQTSSPWQTDQYVGSGFDFPDHSATLSDIMGGVAVKTNPNKVSSSIQTEPQFVAHEPDFQRGLSQQDGAGPTENIHNPLAAAQVAGALSYS